MFWGFLLGIPVGIILGIAMCARYEILMEKPRSHKDTDDRR